MIRILFSLLIIGTLASCGDKNGNTDSNNTSTDTTANVGQDTTASTETQFGAVIDPTGASSLAEVFVAMVDETKLQEATIGQNEDGTPVTVMAVKTKVEGTVASVCQVKGCWMKIQGEEGKELFVKMKDYGFFVPKDISGKTVVMEGLAYTEVTPVDELRHYAEDDGASAEEIAAITEPKTEYKFMADGITIKQ